MLIDPRGYRIKRRIAKQTTDRERSPLRDYRENLCSRNRYFDLVFFLAKHLLRRDQAKRSRKSSQEGAFPANLPIAGGTSRHSAGSFYRARSSPTSLHLLRSSVASSSPLTQYPLPPFRLPVPGFSPFSTFSFFVFCRLVFQRDLALWSPLLVAFPRRSRQIPSAWRSASARGIVVSFDNETG